MAAAMTSEENAAKQKWSRALARNRESGFRRPYLKTSFLSGRNAWRSAIFNGKIFGTLGVGLSAYSAIEASENFAKKPTLGKFADTIIGTGQAVVGILSLGVALGAFATIAAPVAIIASVGIVYGMVDLSSKYNTGKSFAQAILDKPSGCD